MMWGYRGNGYAGLDLTAEQRKQIDEIQSRTAQAMWPLMQQMHQQRYALRRTPGQGDDPSARQAFQTMQATQQAMFAMQLEARKQIDAVLTQEQREQLGRLGGNR